MRLFALLVCWLGAWPALAQWQEARVYLRTDDRATILGTALHIMPGSAPAPGQWHQRDLKAQGVPADAVAVFVTGLQIITHGVTPEQCDMTIAFRAPGSGLTPDLYLGQVVEAHLGGGQRSGLAAWIPVRDGVFEYQYRLSGRNDWPARCSYGITLALQAYAR